MNVTRPVVGSNDEEKSLKSVAPTVPSKLRDSTSSDDARGGGAVGSSCIWAPKRVWSTVPAMKDWPTNGFELVASGGWSRLFSSTEPAWHGRRHAGKGQRDDGDG